MTLSQKEKQILRDLQTQEQVCIDRYNKFAGEAHDTVLKELFTTLEKNEQKHYDTLSQILEGSVPECDCNDDDGRNYCPEATYTSKGNSQEKKDDCFLVTDSIGGEKMVSTEYNNNVFIFSDSDIRKILADIQIEEQNHAEMLYKYKMVNSMS